ncbi:MAG: DUF2141 domain-containing protein [Bacteroidota bacterium]
MNLSMLLLLLVIQDHSLKVTIRNVKNEQGSVLVAVYRSADDFMNKRFRSLKLPAVKGQVVGSFDDHPPGVYAISILHDFNNDMELNKNGLGIPLEGVGFSNDATGRFGPPDFKKASFEFSESKELIIDMKYW